jgi:YD repeat-containing protein
MPHTKGRLRHSFRDIDQLKGRKEGKVWTVPADEKNPDGIRYRLVYIPAGRKSPAVLYDNHHPKGHHKHVDGQEVPYEYRSFENLLKDFRRDIEAFHEDARN